MKKKKKGFTLTELIAVIVILGVIGLIGIPAYNSIRSRTLETQYENTVSLIETEAAKYAQKNSTNLTNVEELIKAGLLETDDGSNIYDPRNKNKLNCYLVEIDYANGQYKSKWLDFEVKDSNGSCDLAAAKAKLGTVGININKKSDNSKVTSGEWVEEDVKLSANLKDVSASDVTGYKWVSGNGYSSKENAITTNVNTILNTTYHLEVRTEDNIYFAEANIKVDKQVPIVKSVEVTPGSDWESGRDIKIVATDQKGSGIAGYYVGTEACDSGVTFEEVKSTKKEVKIDSNIIFEAQQKGIIKYNVCVKDKVGNIGTYGEGIEISVEDAIAPICDWSESGESTEWATKREITVKCIDNESGCDPQYREFTENYNTTTKTATLTRIIKDKAGNETKCSKEVNVYVDKTAPTKPDITNPTNENWTNKPFALTLKSNDNESGIESYQYTYNEKATSVGTSHDTYWVKQSNSATTEHKTDNFTWERNQAVYWRVCDKLGNCSEVSSTKIRLDKTAPTVPTSEIRVSNSGGKKITDAQTDKWRKDTMWWGKFSSSAGTGSPIDHYEYSTNCTGTKTGNLSDSYTYDTDRNWQFCIRAIDQAGNASSWSSKYYFKIDKTAPTVPTSEIRESNSGGKKITDAQTDKWRKDTMWWGKFSSSAGTGSPIDHYEYSTNCTGTKTGNLSDSYTYDTDRNWQFCIRAIDQAGNASSWSSKYYFKIDKTAPTKPTISNPTNGNWSNKDITLTLSSSDGGSGIESYQYTYNANATSVGTNHDTYWVKQSGSASKTQVTSLFTAERNQNAYWRVCDNVGNCSDKNNTMIKIDKTAPTCTKSGDSTTWTNGNRTISWGCNDSRSGCNASYSGSSKAFTTTTTTATIAAYTIKDNAGNTTTCNARTANVYVDKTAPTCTNSGDSTTWTNGNRTIYWGCNDSQSGCNASYSGSSKAFTTSTTTATIAAYTIKDKVGNTTTCSARTANVYVDKTAPTCTSSGDSTTWTNGNRTIYWGCNDSQSGCNASYSGSSKAFTTSTKTANIAAYTIKDIVGNTTTCGARTANVYVDKEAPTINKTNITSANCVKKWCSTSAYNKKCMEITFKDNFSSTLTYDYAFCYEYSGKPYSCNKVEGGITYSAYNRLYYFLANKANLPNDGYKVGTNRTVSLSSGVGYAPFCTGTPDVKVNYSLKVCDQANNCTGVVTKGSNGTALNAS